MRKTILFFGVLVMLFAFSTQATDAPTGVGVGNYVSASEVKDVLTKVNLNKISDTVTRMIDGGNANVGVAVLHRPKSPKGQAGPPMLHSALIEIYYVVEGRMVMVTGGKLLNPKPVAGPNLERNSLGPSTTGSGGDPTGGQTTTMGPGDIMFVPAGTVHYIDEIMEPVTILDYRIDATKQNTLHAGPSPVFTP
jgi:mannose-6-phosphate isomerase-like protein (cupin superfamily)